jgi:hypothetical protein
LIRLDGSLIDNDVSADGLQDETDLSFANGAKFTTPVSLKGAKIDGDLNMTGAGFDGGRLVPRRWRLFVHALRRRQ